MYLFNQNWHGESVPTMAHLCTNFGTFVYSVAKHCKKLIGSGFLQKSGYLGYRHGYEGFTLVLETNCIRNVQPASQPAFIISLTILGISARSPKLYLKVFLSIIDNLCKMQKDT